MLIRKPADIPYSEITPKSIWVRRREFIKLATGAGAGLLLPETGLLAQTGQKLPGVKSSPLSTTGEKLNSYRDITTYNNYYEFGTDKADPAQNSKAFPTNPWTLTIEGEVAKPKVLGYDDLFSTLPLEERVYRMRCVEAWSVVVPWVGFPLGELLRRVEPTPKAKFVSFETMYSRRHMLTEREIGIPLPYVDGLRLDEAMHPLTILAVGLYGEKLPNQNGAPIRLVVPWKYGFKGVKSIVKIRLTENQPRSTWNVTNPQEYGFYSNVNPQVDHPRWTQATERRLGELLRRKTLPFNGYADQVASMYSGMDLRKFY